MKWMFAFIAMHLFSIQLAGMDGAILPTIVIGFVLVFGAIWEATKS